MPQGGAEQRLLKLSIGVTVLVSLSIMFDGVFFVSRLVSLDAQSWLRGISLQVVRQLRRHRRPELALVCGSGGSGRI